MNRHPTEANWCQTRGGVPRGPVSWSRRSGPHVALLPTVSRCLDVPVSRLPQRRDRVPSGAGQARCTTPRQGCGAKRSTRKGLALTRGWYTGCARTGGSFVVYVVNGLPRLMTR
jgi:hypothetical protein